MSKDASKKNKKHPKSETTKAAMNALKDAPVIREAWIAAIEAGAAAAIAVIRKATDEELVKALPLEPTFEKKQKKKGKTDEPSTQTAQETAPAA